MRANCEVMRCFKNIKVRTKVGLSRGVWVTIAC